MGSVEELVKNDASYSKEFRQWNQDTSNMNRTDALLQLFWILCLSGYFRNADIDLKTATSKALKEILSKTNIFKIKPVQIAIQVIQIVIWASISEEFEKIVSEVDKENEEEGVQKAIQKASSFDNNEITSLTNLLKNLSGITVKKGTRTIKAENPKDNVEVTSLIFKYEKSSNT